MVIIYRFAQRSNSYVSRRLLFNASLFIRLPNIRSPDFNHDTDPSYLR